MQKVGSLGAKLARPSGVAEVLAGREEVDDAEVRLGRDQLGVAPDQLACDVGGLLARDRYVEPRILRRLVEALDMVVQAIGFMVEGPQLVGDGRAQHDPEVVDVQMGFGSWGELAA